jgi:hypothetical protein
MLNQELLNKNNLPVEVKYTSEKMINENMRKGVSMKTKALVVLLSFIMAFIAIPGFSQILDENYDSQGEELGEEAGTSLIQDLDEIKARAIKNIIQRIRKGDPTVLKFVVYDVMVEVHKQIIGYIEESRLRSARKIETTNYYREMGWTASLHAFIGGFDNQDPKVRLRCIGYLGDWVDDIGLDIQMIGKAAYDRLNSLIETREEVRYALELLRLKVLRKIFLNQVYNGDENVLKQIDPEQFIVLVQNEDFIRQVFCVPQDIIIRSIRLDPWWLRWTLAGYVEHQDLTTEGNKAAKRSEEPYVSQNYPQYKYKMSQNTLYRNYPDEKGISEDRKYGYLDDGKYLDIISLYDQRYFKYSPEGDRYINEDRYLRAIMAGLENSSLFVKENCARIVVRMTDGPQYDPYDPDNSFNAGDDITVIQERIYEIKDSEGNVKSVKGNLERLAKQAKYVQIARKAWDDVKFAQFVDVHQRVDPINATTRSLTYKSGAKDLGMIDGVQVHRDLGGGTVFNHINPWGYTYNYRTDMADIMRRMGLGKYVDTCYREAAEQISISTGRRYFVEDLFDLDELSPDHVIPTWHGKDEIKDEVFETP